MVCLWGTVINSTLYNNTTPNSVGGGIFVLFNRFNRNNPFILQNSILVGNTARDAASGRQVYVDNEDAANVATTLQNNLIEGGANPMGTDQGVTYRIPGSANITQTGTLDATAAAVFASTDAMNTNYLRLRTGSPAVGAGNNDYLNNGTPANTDDDIKTDAAGDVRIQGGTVDLGAYESAFAAPTPQIIDFTLANTGTVGDKIDLTAAADSGLEVTFTSSDETVAAIGTGADAGKLVLKAEGTTIITASQDGDDTYAAATDVTQTITVEAAGTQTPTTHTGDISVTTQAEVDALRTSLTAGVTRIEGNVTIGPASGMSDINDLSPLAAITEIIGNVIVRRNPDLPNLMGLNQLQTIWGDFGVYGNDDLTSLGDFPALQFIGGDFVVGRYDAGNDDLTSLGDFPALQSIGDRFSVLSNDLLTSLGDFTALQSIGGYFNVSSNNALTSLGDFTALQSIGGYFNVSSNNVLTSLGDFPALQSIGDRFSVLSNDLLTSLGDFTALQSIGDGFYVSNNDDLTSLRDFPALQSIGDRFSVFSNDLLTSLGDFTALQSIGGYFGVRNNDALTSLGAFPMLASIGSSDGISVPSTGTNEDNVSIVVENNNRLQDCCVLTEFLRGATSAVSGQIFIGNNAQGCSSTTEVNCDPFLQVGQKMVFIAKTATEGTLEIFSRGHWQLSKSGTGADWITNIAASGDNNDASSITGENDASIAITTTVNPNNARRSTTLTLRVIDMADNALTDPAPITIPFTQLGIAHVGDISVTTQAEVNALTFPANATAIQGNVTIGPDFGTSDISDLSPLAAITEITGNVVVQNNPDLPNLVGLNQLQTIDGYFWVNSNAVLTSLGDFTALQTIGGNFSVSFNAALISLGGFPMLASIGIADGVSVPNTGNEDGVSIVVARNNRLQDCCVLTEFLSGATSAVSGQVFINDNASGCSSTTEVNCGPFLQVGQKIVFAAKTAGEGTLDIFSTLRWQLSKPNTGADWITNIAADGGNSDASSITGENDASIAITTTANPSNAGRSTTLTLTAMDMDGNALTDPAPITIPFTQLGTAHIGDVTLYSQAEVNALVLPANATSIQGNLIIGNYNSNSDITDLRPLSGITYVTGRVRVSSNDRLVSLDPLGNLQAIGGSFEVSYNDDLTSLGNFTALQSIGSSFSVSNNDALTSLGNFSTLQSIGGYFWMSSNASLTSLGNFAALQTIGSFFQVSSNDELTSLGNFSTLQTIGGDFDVSENDELTSLGDFPALQSIGGDFVVGRYNAGNAVLTSLGNFTALQTIGGSFDVLENAVLTSLGNFSTLQTIDGYFEVSFNDELTSLGDFSTLQTIGSFFNVRDNAVLTSLGDFSTLQSIGRFFQVFSNDELTSLGNFSALQTIGDDFYVFENAVLTSLGDFPALQSIGDFVVSNNEALTSLGNFSALQTVGDYFYVFENAVLTSLGDFSTLQSIGGGFSVSSNDELTSLGNFSTLQSIGDYFWVSSNDELTSLGDFTALQSIGGSFYMRNNDELTSLGAFPMLTSIGSSDEILVSSTGAEEDDVSIVVEGNDLLQDCCVLTEFLRGATSAVSGQVFIGDNATGCSSEAEITPCTVSKQAQAITFSAPSDNITGTVGDDIALEAMANSGLNVSFSINPTTGVATLVDVGDGTGTLTLIGEGTVTITASQDGDDTYAAATDVTRTIIAGTQTPNTHTGDVSVTTQAEVDALRTSLTPDATHIAGNVAIGLELSTSDITDLSPLAAITEVTGNVIIHRNRDLPNLMGLNQLQFIGGDFAVVNNADLTSLGDFTTLQSIGGGFAVVNNGDLTSLGNFSALQSIGGDFEVENNADLTSLGDFTTLQSIGGGFEVGENGDLPSLGDFTALQSIGGDFEMSDNATLTSLGNFTVLQSIGGGFEVSGNDFLTSLEDFTVLQSIGGRFEVSDNAALTSVRDFTALQTIRGSFEVSGNAVLNSLRDFSVLQSIGGGFEVSGTVDLTSLGDFSVLQSIGGSFKMSDNDVLTSLGDFTALQTIGGSFEIYNNAVLTSPGEFLMLTSIGSANGIPVPSTGTEEDNVSILVEGNDLLQDCCVLVEFLSGATNAVSGQIFIGDNAPGCSSTAEVNCDFLKTDLKVVFVARTATEGTLEIFSTLPWQLSKPTTGAEWITNIAADGGNSEASSITGGEDASITITATANPNNEGRSTTLTLTAMDMAGDALTNPPPVMILFTQLGSTYIGDITLTSQASVNAFPTDVTVTQNKKSSLQGKRANAFSTNVTAIQGNLIIGNYNSDSDITDLRPLSSITHVTGSVEIVRNSRLVSLGFLINLQAIGGGFRVVGNNLLQDCCVLTEFLSGSTNAVSGQVSIDDNASGCGTTTQVNCDPFLQVGQKVVLAAKTATESTLEAFSRQQWQLSKPAEVEWITNMEAEGSTSDATSITGENDAFITITTKANPDNTGRSTKLTLTAIDVDGTALDNMESITVPFTQLGISHTGNVSVATQAEVDALRTSLTTDATRIVGNVTIGSASGMSDIDDLSQLAAIIEITGNVIVRRNPDLPNLIGLSQLQIIGGKFEVNRNAALTSLGDFTDLESIGGSFVVGGPSSDDGNVALLSLGDFRTLQTIGGSFVVERNRSLTSLGDFRALHTIGDSFVVSSFALTSLGDFTALQTIKGDFEVNFTALPSLGDYFTALQTIGGTFVVNINDALTSLGNFPALETIGDDFEVTKNTTLTSLGNFSALQSIGDDFEVTKNDILPSLGDFTNLQTIGGIFEVGGNAALTSLGDFTALKVIGDDFDVIDNDVLKSLGDFTNLQFIGDFEVGNNFALTSLGNFPALQFMGDFFVEVNDGLESLGDFPVLESIDGSFVMNYNDGLTSLGDFTALQTIGGSFGVVGTSALTSLGDFPALQTIGSGLVMDFNAALTSLGEFPALESIGSVDEVLVLSTGGNQDDVSILVENNDLLEECCVLTTFFSGSTNAVSGQVIIFNNATGCSSRAEINTCGGGSPSIRRVTTTGDALGDGSDWTKAMTLQAALEASTTVGDQVWIAEGTYKPDATDRAATFTVPAGVLVYGGFVGTEADDFDPANTARTGAATILSGDLADNDVGREEADYNALRNDNSYSVVTVTGPGATLDGVTITAGESGTSGVGGGLYAVLGAATNMMVRDCLFTNNNADNSGGGAYFTESTILTGCTFTDNTAVENGGGAFFDAVLLGEASRLTDCTFTGNEAGKDGGGAYFGGVLFGEAATLTGCTFTDNTTEESGGGTYFSFGEIATLMGCTFKDNEAGKGGGMFIEEVEEAMLTDCIFTGNEAKYSYGGGAGFSETAMLTNCVVVGNSAAGSGGGLVFSTGGTVINSTFYNNTTDTQGGGLAVFFNDTHVMVGIQTNPFTLQNSILIDNTATTAGDAVYLVYEAPLMPSNIEATIDRNLLGSGMADLGVGVYDRVTSIYTDDRLANAWNVTLSNTIKESDAAVVFASTDAVNADYLRVAAGSPAVNSGNNNYIPSGITTDLVGNIRIQGGRIDLGAYESDVKLTQEITFIAPAADESGTVGQTTPIPLTAMTNAMGLFVSFSIDPATGVATLTDNGDGTGSLTLDGAGTVIVTASQAGNATYESATPVTRTITVTKQSQVITFDDPTGGATVRTGQTISLTATTDAPGLLVSFSTDPATGIASLTDNGDGTGSLTLDDVGTVMVTASQAGNETYAAADVTHTITVEAVLGIEEGIDDFVLYPNPVSGELHFSEQVAEFRLYGIEGRLLETWKNVRSVDLTARHAGLYFAEVIRGGRNVRYRIMRE